MTREYPSKSRSLGYELMDRHLVRAVLAMMLLLALAMIAGCFGGDSDDGLPIEEDLELDRCETGEMWDGEAGCRPVGWTDCDGGFVPHGSGWGCTARLASGCPDGKRPVFGQETCKPVGMNECAPAFDADPSGWGCRDRLPEDLSCEEHERPDPMEGCVPIGDCQGEFPPPGATHFVDAELSDEDLDANHFRSIAAAVEQAPQGAVIAVEAGTYSGSLIFERPMSVIGRCAAQVVLEAGGSTLPGLAVSEDFEVLVEGLTVRGFTLGAQVEYGGDLELKDSIIEDSPLAGMFVLDSGTRATVVGSVVRRSLPEGARFGQGIGASYGSELILARSAVLENHEMGLLIHEGSSARVEGSVIGMTLPRGDGRFGHGIVCQAEGSSLTLHQSVVAYNRAFAVQVSPGAEAVLSQSVIRDVTEGLDATGEDNSAAVAVMGGVATLEDVTIADAVSYGLYVNTPESSVTASRLTLSRTGEIEREASVYVMQGATADLSSLAVTSSHGRGLVAAEGASAFVSDSYVRDIKEPGWPGILVQQSASLIVEDVAVKGIALAGVGATDLGSHLELRDAVIEDVRMDTRTGDDGIAVGVFVQLDAQAVVENVTIRGSEAVGMAASDGASISGRRVEIEDSSTLPDSGGVYGYGVIAQKDSFIALERAAVRRSWGAGAISSVDSVLELEKSVLHDGEREPAGSRGRGLVVQFGSKARVMDSAIVDNGQLGVFSFGAGTEMEMRQSLVAENVPLEDGEFGTGVLAALGSSAVLHGAEIRGHPGRAVHSEASSITIGGCLLRENAVGIHLDGSELSEVASLPEDPPKGEVLVTVDTRFVGNEMTVDSGVLPLPSVPSELP